jgi:hypothetical protein
MLATAAVARARAVGAPVDARRKYTTGELVASWIAACHAGQHTPSIDYRKAADGRGGKEIATKTTEPM